MPIMVKYNNDECTIRPTPFVSVSTNILKNGAGEAFGVTYSITLPGTLLPDEGSPYAYIIDGSVPSKRFDFYSDEPSKKGPYGAFDTNVSHAYNVSPVGYKQPPRQKVSANDAATAIFSKQRALRALFARDGQKVEITDVVGNLTTFSCFPRIIDISFTEGTYVDKCEYTISLEADTLLYGDEAIVVDAEGTLVANQGGLTDENKTEEELIEDYKAAFVSDFSEDWAIEVDEAQGESTALPRSYRITHNLSATGKTHYTPKGDGTSEKLDAWIQAKTFVQNRMSNTKTTPGYVSSINDYPNIMGQIGSGTLELVNTYGGYNHVRTENLSEHAGSYSISENWLIATGTAYENYNQNVSTSNTEPFINVNVDGTIKGLSQLSPSGYGGLDDTKLPNAYDNALTKYNEISNYGNFGVGSHAYKRANNTVAVQLNSQPVSVSLGTNEFTGEITYSLGFNNRPTNIISGVVSETISVNDTYPGDIFAVIPVLGRSTGPILQYVGGRSEYKRDISVNLTMDYTKIPYGYERNPLLLKKPSVVEPIASQIAGLLKELSPQGEPGVRKYFVSPPSETWNPKEGTYNFNISFTYELDK